MNIQNIARSARLYARSEAMVAEIRMRAYGRKLAFTSLAVLTSVMGLAFLNLAAFLYLQSLWGPVWTPLAIGLANFAIAALALLAAFSARPGPELALARELRKLSSTALEEEFHAAHSVGGLLGALAGGSEAKIAQLLLPAVISIVSSLGRKKAAARKQ
jgi:hypothetical protein